MSRLVSGELNDSIAGDTTEDFIVREGAQLNSVLNTTSKRNISGRTSGMMKSIRDSVGFMATNKYGEGRRIEEDDDEPTKHVSIRNRQS